MDWVALSSRYYMDLDDLSVPESAQTLLTRAMAYMALNETSGFLPRTALGKLGLSRVTRRLEHLIRVRIAVERADGSGWDFPAWFKWNEPLERQVKKRKADRERVAAKRSEAENVARQSGDVSRDVASPPHRTTQRSPKGDLSTPGRNARTRNGGSRSDDAIDRLNDTAHSLRAHKLTGRYADDNGPIDTSTRVGIAKAIDECDGYADDVILAGLVAWRDSPMVSPKTIPQFVHKANRPTTNGNGPRLSTADQRVAAAQALKRPEWGNGQPPQELLP